MGELKALIFRELAKSLTQGDTFAAKCRFLCLIYTKIERFVYRISLGEAWLSNVFSHIGKARLLLSLVQKTILD